MSTQPAQSLGTPQLPVQHHYLAPDGSQIRELLTLSGGNIAHCTMLAGGISNAVVHRTVEVIWYCLSGLSQVWRKLGPVEEVTDLRPATCLTIPVARTSSSATRTNRPCAS
jgi:mannose-6-phosphate isomerase-like protein (cupin superfamily)